jgi:hypothetical protein
MTTTLRLRPAVQAVSIVLLGLGVAACGRAAGSSPSSSPKTTTRGSFNGAAGTLVQITPSSLTLATVTGGDVTVAYSSATPVIDTSTGSYQDITVGSCITATGSRGAGGAITLASLTLAQPVSGSCNARTILGGSHGALPSGSARPSFRARPSLPPNVVAIRGQVTAVGGTTVTIKDLQTGTSETVTVPTTVTVDITSQGSDSDLTQGVCVLAAGQKDSSGNITARTLAIEPPGPSGCFTGSNRLGGLGGAGGGGGGPVFIGGSGK